MKTPQQLLQQTLEVGECLLPDASPGGRTPYPTVFVHGLLGWGARDALYRAKITLSTPDVFAWTLVIVLLSALLSTVAARLLRAVKARLCGEVQA